MDSFIHESVPTPTRWLVTDPKRRKNNQGEYPDTKEKAPVVVTNEGGKRPYPMSSNEKFTQGVENRAKIEIANV